MDVGPTGTIHWLHLVSFDHAKHLRVMAYVVRAAAVQKASGDRVRGAAFEFMPESDESIAAVQDFVKYVLGRRASGMLPQSRRTSPPTPPRARTRRPAPGASPSCAS